jgi:integrase
MRMTLRDMIAKGEVRKCHVHAFRRTFKTWATEVIKEQWDIIELCLSHPPGTAVAQAYLGGDALGKRREIMDLWAKFCG